MDKIFAIYWFAILFIVAGGIVYMTYLFYGAPYDIRNIESNLLSNQIANCITNKGYLNTTAIFSSDFKNNLFNDCNINTNVEDVYGWKAQLQYYTEISVYNFDQNAPGDLGDSLLSISAGNPDVKTAWELGSLKSPSILQRKVTTIVIHATEGSDALGAIETISQNGLSIHYMIDRDGNIISYNNENQFAPAQYQNAFQPESAMAQHAGCNIGTGSNDFSTAPITRPKCSPSCIDTDGLLDPSCQFSANPAQSVWCCLPNFNVNSIGIELVNLGPLCTTNKGSSQCANSLSADGQQWANYTPAQINALVNLVADITSRYNIPIDRDHIIGHYQITTFKTDPGPQFPWDTFIQSVIQRSSESSSSASVSQQKNLPQGQIRSFYVSDKDGKQYVVKIMALVRKTEKNVA